MRGQNLPFEIDPELAEVADQSFEDGPQDESAKDVFPVINPTHQHLTQIQHLS